jgi:hypothetical protein
MAKAVIGAQPTSGELVMRGDASRAQGDSAGARVASVEALQLALAMGDVDAMVEAARRLPNLLPFGLHPGPIPALIHEAYTAAPDGPRKGVLAAALARAWVYGGDAGRATRFADEAVVAAERCGDDVVLADALDVAIAARWGPDDFDQRRTLAARLVDTASHLGDPEARLSAHLWRLTTSWECLDIVTVHRQLRALDDLAEETGSLRIAFFAASRRAMYALATADPAAPDWVERTTRLGDEAAEPDAFEVMHTLRADVARQSGDQELLKEEAAVFEHYGAAEGIGAVTVEAAELWLSCGEVDRAASLALQVAGAGLEAVPRDVDFLLAVAKLAYIASAAGLDELTRATAHCLEPYAGRAVLNGGALVFAGVVDEYLYRTGVALGRDDAARFRDAAALAYRRIGAREWLRRLGESRPAASTASTTLAAAAEKHASPARFAREGDAWRASYGGSEVVVRNSKGMVDLSRLLAAPARPIPAIELVAEAAGMRGAARDDELHHPGDLGEVVDSTARSAYQRRLGELAGEIDEADATGDAERSTRLLIERDALVEQLSAAYGLGRRPRRAGDPAERARTAVTGRIHAAISRIEELHPDLGHHLKRSVQTGRLCVYEPESPVDWVLQ